MGDLRRSIREDFPEEVTPKLRREAHGGVSCTLGRKAKASSEEPSKNLGRSLEFHPRAMEANGWF